MSGEERQEKALVKATGPAECAIASLVAPKTDPLTTLSKQATGVVEQRVFRDSRTT